MQQLSKKLLSWATDLEPQAEEQARLSSELPFVHGHVALMPDAHWGMGATIGSVIPTLGAIVPAAVGVDIGCGMIAAQLSVYGSRPLTSHDLPIDLDFLHRQISKRVPAGVGMGHTTMSELKSHTNTAAWEKYGEELETTAAKQLGSLGSGNHFVEICLDELDRVWIVLHSGSRGVGNKLATVHIDIAKGLMKDWFINLADPNLAYLVEGTEPFNEYIADMLWAQDYAMENRVRMMMSVLRAMQWTIASTIDISETVNCHHNFTTRERHQGKDVWLTRKGAIRARVGDKGVIPGSMGTRSYIVSGLGNPASFDSCSHGAGRRLGRKEAKRQLNTASFHEAMAGKTWNSLDAEALLDEHPSAYKDIDVVMENQKDLVTIEHVLHQVLNYKGL